MDKLLVSGPGPGLMRKLFQVLIIAGCLVGAFADSSQLFAADATAAMCPVMPGSRGKSKFTVEYKGKKIPLCCRSCVKKFNRNPTRYVQE